MSEALKGAQARKTRVTSDLQAENRKRCSENGCLAGENIEGYQNSTTAMTVVTNTRQTQLAQDTQLFACEGTQAELASRQS